MTTALAVQSVSVDGWSAYDYPDPPTDDDGNLWVWQTIDGWFGGLPVRGSAIERPMQDGVTDGPAPFGARTISLAGALVAQDRAGLQRGMDRIARVLASSVRVGPLVVAEGMVPLSRQVQVRLGGPTLIKRTGPVSADWSLSLFSPDSVRVGVTSKSLTLSSLDVRAGRVYNLLHNRVYTGGSAGGAGTARNDGDHRAYPSFTFLGPSINPTLTVGGVVQRRMTYLATLAANESLTIDTAARTVTLNGSASRRYLLSSDSQWLYFQPGDNPLVYTTSGTLPTVGQCLVSWRDTWS